jgi:NhaA family Na+:H+ antiporter
LGDSYGDGHRLPSAGTWIVVVALVVGKPLGIVITAGFGFTVALFFATAAFPVGALLDETKMGALLSFTAGPVAALAALTLRVGRFAPDRG